MTQQVNLLNRALIRPRDWLSLSNMMIIYALALIIMVLLYNMSLTQMTLAQEKRNQVIGEFENLQKELQIVTNARATPANAESQQKELQSLMQKKALQDKVLTVFLQVEKDSGHHLLDYMLGFAHQKTQNVWLTGFKIDPFIHSLSLTGKALNAELVPKFIEQLSLEPVFKGQLFGGLTIKAAEQSDARRKETPVATEVKVLANNPVKTDNTVVPLVEFEIKGMEQGVTAKTSESAAADANNEDDLMGKVKEMRHG